MGWRSVLAAIALAGALGQGARAGIRTIPADANSFQGITSIGGGFAGGVNTISAGSTPIRMLIIHGMGTASEGEYDTFMLEIAGKFGLAQTPPVRETLPPPCGEPVAPPAPGLTRPQPIRIDIAGVPADDQARLYTYDFASGGGTAPALTISYLLWSPLTCQIKSAPRLREKGHPPWQVVTSAAKDFIDDKFGDVVLYIGDYRAAVMRPSVEKALCLFVGGQPGGGDDCALPQATSPSIVVTHSLGSYMLMDAIDDELGRATSGPTAASRLVGSTRFIYMMANQLPLLDLSTLPGYPAYVDAAGESQWTSTASKFLGHLRDLTPKSGGQLLNGGAAFDRQVIAFSDPNDILSYLVRPGALGLPPSQDPALFLSNVYMGNGELSIPGLVSNPVGAHLGYFTNRRVIDLLVCGMDHGKVKQPCPAGP
jgi:hypothetical protein